MKKLTLLIVLTGFFGLIHAQLKMNSSGNIGLGCDPTTWSKLYINGSGGFNTSSGTFKFIHS